MFFIRLPISSSLEFLGCQEKKEKKGFNARPFIVVFNETSRSTYRSILIHVYVLGLCQFASMQIENTPTPMNHKIDD